MMFGKPSRSKVGREGIKDGREGEGRGDGRRFPRTPGNRSTPSLVPSVTEIDVLETVKTETEEEDVEPSSSLTLSID